MGFADAGKLGGAKLLEYGTSADVQNDGTVPDSFVGYAAMAFN
jgi:predicted class III extradiol MEMO1 family dioxygenase